MGEGVARAPECRGERHAVDVPGRARGRRVEVAVRVDPDDATRLARRSPEACERPERDRMVATEHERHRAARERSPPRSPRGPHRRRGSPAGSGRARPRPQAPRAPVPGRSRGRRPRIRTTRAAPRARHSGSRTAPCRRRGGPARDRGARRRSSRSGAWRPRQRRLPGRHGAVHAASRRARRSGSVRHGSRARGDDVGRPRALRRAELAEAVAADGYDPDMILSIARGGLLIGAAASATRSG